MGGEQTQRDHGDDEPIAQRPGQQQDQCAPEQESRWDIDKHEGRQREGFRRDPRLGIQVVDHESANLD